MLDAHRFLAPDLLESVVLANGRLHHVHHGGTAIHDDPFAVVFTLGAWLVEAGFTHRIAHTGGQRFGLAIGRTAGHDDPFEQGGQRFGVEHLDVLGFDVLQAIDDGALEFLDVLFGSGFAHVGVS